MMLSLSPRLQRLTVDSLPKGINSRRCWCLCVCDSPGREGDVGRNKMYGTGGFNSYFGLKLVFKDGFWKCLLVFGKDLKRSETSRCLERDKRAWEGLEGLENS